MSKLYCTRLHENSRHGKVRVNSTLLIWLNEIVSIRVAFAALTLCSAAFFCGCSDDDENNGNQNGGGTSQTDKEINGLTLGSVGSGTQFDHIQVSYSNDDSFEWFGGTVNAKYFVAYKGWDDDFDPDNADY